MDALARCSAATQTALLPAIADLAHQGLDDGRDEPSGTQCSELETEQTFRLVGVELIDRLEDPRQRGARLLPGAGGPAAQLGVREPGDVTDRMPGSGGPAPDRVGHGMAAERIP
jgi:hypothetical protein